MVEQSVGAWATVRFNAADETAYRSYMRARIVPLLRIGALIGAGAFSGFFAWDYLLLDDPLWVTGPIRLAVVLFMRVGSVLPQRVPARRFGVAANGLCLSRPLIYASHLFPNPATAFP